jgi:hypothetical protein
MGQGTSFADYEILLTAHSEKLEQVLRTLLDIRGSLDVKKSVSSKWERKAFFC